MQVRSTVTLTEKEEVFVIALACGLPETSAARASGWAVGSARNNLRKPHISAAVRQVHASLGRVIARMEKHIGTGRDA